MSKTLIHLTCILVIGCSSKLMGQGTTQALNSITQSDLMKHIRFLADDSLEGRASGSDGNVRAAEYLAKEFARIGLKHAGTNGSYLQPFKIGLNAKLGKNNRLVVRSKKGTSLKLGQDFLPFDQLDKGSGKGKVVFVGYGITAKEEKFDDYAGIDASNKVVLLMRKIPRENKEDAVFTASDGRPNQHAFFVTKLQNAQKHGASAVLIVDASAKREEVSKMSKGSPRPLGGAKTKIPFSFVSYEIASNWIASAGHSLPGLVREIDRTHQPKSFDLDLSVELEVEVTRETATVNNLIGLLSGSDPKLKNEFVVVGGHMDHIGFGINPTDWGKTERIHNGADDNASGTAAVLEMAEAFSSLKKHPKRNLLFMAFNAEERGLLGSRHYVENPTVPLTNIVAMINLDMVGRGASGVDIGGVGTSPGFKPMIDALATNYDLRVTTNPGGKAPSDNTSFYNKDIPVLFYFTGRHDDYHKPSDDWQRIDKAQIESITRLAYLSVDRIANADKRPEFRKSDGNPTRRGRARILLGVVIDVGHQGEGVKVQSVMPNFPAARAKIKPGDILLKLGDAKTDELSEIGKALQKVKRGQSLKGTVKRGEETLEFEFKF